MRISIFIDLKKACDFICDLIVRHVSFDVNFGEIDTPDGLKQSIVVSYDVVFVSAR